MLNYLEPSNNKKRRRKNKRTAATRTSSTFTSTSIRSSASNEELETAKAAAIKLLEHSSDSRWHIHPSCSNNLKLISNPTQVNLSTQLQDLSATTPPLSTLATKSPRIIGSESKNQSSTVVSTSKGSKQVSKSVNSRETHSSSASHSVPHCLQPNQSSSSPHQNLKLKPSFHVTREEVFSDTAITDAFQAAMNEFNFFRRLERSQSSIIAEAGGEEPELEPIKLPQSSTHQRRVSALYYGQPPTQSISKTKKPRLDSIFLPHITIPIDPIIKQVEAREVTERDDERGTCDSTSRPGNQSSGSEMDMEDYWDMIGSQSDGESAAVDDNDEVNHEETPEDDGKENKSIGPTKANQSVSAMTVSNEAESKLTSINTTHHNPTQVIPFSTSDVQLNEGTRVANHSMNADVLTDSQKMLLSNALNAQYWAGYHAAMFNQSLGISFQNLPVLIPQNQNQHHFNNPVTSSSSVALNYSPFSSVTSSSKSSLD